MVIIDTNINISHSNCYLEFEIYRHLGALFFSYVLKYGIYQFCLIFIREETRDMFYHAYNAYMENAYPADELMPLSCQGRYRGLTPNRGDIDDSLGK